ncbi:MAG: glycerol-3-phosphate dehydrogenase/oxidase [Gemmatimonadaceae bacterium]|nr:glycerol-3-phosphate dehydrogenase/oxidase [Gemmatimonadaceae bacterium]
MSAPGPLRATLLDRLRREPFDLLVIGGGITGAGVARDAALRGLRVALVEQGDFASGTSSRSSRLVHGGVRYLEQGWFHLVFEASRERRTLLRIAPHLVRPLPFTWPVYRGDRVPRWKLRAGLTLYDLLALFRNVGRHRALDAAEVHAREECLRETALLGGAAYWDAATDDARLTLANALDAVAHGAAVLNHLAVRALTFDSATCTGAEVVDRAGGSAFPVQARVVVNATGPWTDVIRRQEDPDAPTALRGTKGVHVAVPRARLPIRGAVTLTAPQDGRVMFLLPAGALSIIGTTDTRSEAAPDQVRASEADVRYLLEAANAFVPTAALQRDDVVSAWAGLRPLVATSRERTPSSSSREHAITRGARGVITVTGGKLTTYRAMAAEVVDQVERALGVAHRPARTAELPLPGGAFDGIAASVLAARAACRDADIATRLVTAYGADWPSVWALAEADPSLAARLDPALPFIGAEVMHAVARELAVTLGDLLIRRVPVAFAARDHGAAIAARLAPTIGARLGWTDAGVQSALAAYAQECAAIFSIDP